MLRQPEQTSSTLQLVASDMTGIMENLDTRELALGDGDYDLADGTVPGNVHLCKHKPVVLPIGCSNCPHSLPPGEQLSFMAIYNMVGLKDAGGKIFLSCPITANVTDVERHNAAQDRFNMTAQRSVNKVHAVI